MKRSELVFAGLAIPVDFIALVSAALTAYAVRYMPSIQQIRPVIFDLPFLGFLQTATLLSAAWLLLFGAAGLYAIIGTQRLADEFKRIFIGCTMGLGLVLAIMVFSRYIFDSRFIVIVSYLLAIIYVSTGRFLLRSAQRFLFKYGIGLHRVVIIGSGNVGSILKNEFALDLSLGYRVIAHIPDYAGHQNVLHELVTQHAVDDIVHLQPQGRQDEIAAVLQLIDQYHLGYYYTAGIQDAQLSNFTLQTIAGVPLVEIKATPLDGWGRIIKRIFDICVAGLALIFLAPLLILIAIIIKLDSRGPVFFTYKRIGQFGKPFTYFKFRSMIHNAHQLRFDPHFVEQHTNVRAGTPMMKFKNDPRITRFGRVLRRWSLDELPELFLVVWGSMSLVGPRPHEIEEVERYQRHHRKLLTIKPGITGLAQVSGRSDLDFEQEVKLDTFYIEQWTLMLDIQILLRTPIAVMRKRTTI